jgi:hypothetical protein
MESVSLSISCLPSTPLVNEALLNTVHLTPTHMFVILNYATE